MLRHKFRKLEIKARNLLSVYSSGVHSSNMIDNVDDMNSVKKFQQGDKRIDIKNSVKYHEVMAKSLEPEKQLMVYIVLDTSGSQECSQKYDMAVLTVLYLLFLCESSDEKVGLIASNGKINIAPCTDYLLINDVLSDIKCSGVFNLLASLSTLRYYDPDNAVIFLLSDFYTDIDMNMRNFLKSLSSNNVLYSIILKEEQDNLGNCTLIDSESMQCINAQTGIITYNNWQSKVARYLAMCNCIPVDIDITNYNPLLPLIRKLL